jgi:activating signal cointegrator complex subunit 3
MFLVIVPAFDWSDAIHGHNQPFIIWVEDPDNECIYHQEDFLLTKKDYMKEFINLEFAIPIQEPLPTQYMVKSLSEFWLGGDTMTEISFRHLILPEIHPPTTELLDLMPLPITALQNPAYEKLYIKMFSHFNPVQTQLFHIAYHTDHNMLCGAPTGSGMFKTTVAFLFELV